MCIKCSILSLYLIDNLAGYKIPSSRLFSLKSLRVFLYFLLTLVPMQILFFDGSSLFFLLKTLRIFSVSLNI